MFPLSGGGISLKPSLNSPTMSSDFPVPTATHSIGRGAMRAAIPVRYEMKLSSPCSSEPPPVITTPLSLRSPTSSGGACSSAIPNTYASCSAVSRTGS